MSAYARPIQTKCSRCRAAAKVEVFNTYNSRQGVYCRRCGARRVRELRAAELRAAELVGLTNAGARGERVP